MEQILKVLQSVYNILVVYHPNCPDKKRVFVVSSFTPIQGNIHFLDLRGKDITDIISDQSFYTQFSFERQTGMSATEFQRAQFDTKLDELPLRHYQFAPDYTWEWFLAS